MAVTSLTLANPGAETGDATGWTVRTGSGLAAVTTQGGVVPHAGTYFFKAGEDAAVAWDQQVDISAHAAAIDAGTAAVKFSAYHNSFTDADSGALYIECYADDGTTLLGGNENSESDPSGWTLEELYCALPSGTRHIRVGTSNTRASGVNLDTYWDDFAAEISDDRAADYPGEEFGPRATQAIAYALVSEPAAQLRATQMPILVMGAAETSSGQYDVFAHQVVAYALVRGKADRVDLRAWTFLQDDHLFYGIHLGDGGTIVHDLLTGQWAQWYSPGFDYFRVEDAVDWEGYNLGCDTENGTIWEIDPTGRLDAGTTVITSQVTGQATVRGRRSVPCYLAELACSQAEPAAESGCSIQLRTRDGSDQAWIDHGTLTGAAAGTATLFRYFGLGVMIAPGREFEITNIGYARRLDGFDIELGGDPNAVEVPK